MRITENKKIYKYETHLHTSQGSACAGNTGAEMVDYYKSRGYSGFVVTDHFFNGNTAIDRDLPWDERIELFFAGYEDAKKGGEETDFDVFFGMEYNFRGTEFLFYGLDKKWLLANPGIMTDGLKKTLASVREASGFIIHAHPFREAPYIEMMRLIPGCTDAVETFNAGNCFSGSLYNDRAVIYAEMYGLRMTSGTDIHRVTDGIRGGLAFTERVGTMGGLIDLIYSGNYKMIIDGI